MRQPQHQTPQGRWRLMLGHAYRNARVNRGVSLREVCDRMGMAYVRLSEIERAVVLPRLDEDCALRKALGVDPWSDEGHLLSSLCGLAGGLEDLDL